MLVLGLIVILFFAIHLTQFWAEMQLPELLGKTPESGVDLIKETFSNPLMVVLYLVWFVAIWFHLTHGFWSALQTIGFNNKIWFNRWKLIGNVWATIVLIGFAITAIYFYAISLCGGATCGL